MTRTLTPATPRGRRLALPFYGLVLAAVIAVLVPIASLVEDEPRADLTIVNDSDWSINLDLVLDEGASSIRLGTIGRRRTETFQAIPAPGDVWWFRWRFSDEEVDRRITDQELRSSKYRITVPDELVERLRAAEVPASPF